MFTKNSFALIYWLQLGAAQHMLDFDFLSNREPSILAFVNPWKSRQGHKLFYGNSEILIPSFSDFNSVPEDISSKLDTCINFASFRSAKDATFQAMDSWYFRNIVIVAEWIPERQTLEIIEKNKHQHLNIIWPATVWTMSAGVFRAGNTGGSLENISCSHLYEAGSVGFVSKSGGMSNELRRVIADRTDGTNLSIALGWDKYNIMNFPAAMKIMQEDKNVKMIVMLWEIWGRDELEVARMIEEKEIVKPVVAWCIGTINEQISGEVQFGHAWAKSNKEEETANYKNTALEKAGAIVPKSYMDFWDVIKAEFKKLNTISSSHSNSLRPTDTSLSEGGWKKSPFVEGDVWGTKIGGVSQDLSDKLQIMSERNKTSFTSTISDERGEELLYNWKRISEFTDSPNIGKTLWHLWLKKDLPLYACNFLNTVIVLIADHWPAVSWATNTIVTARAGNDLKSSLISGLATIGPRFGGAIDGAGFYWLNAIKNNISAEDFVSEMKQKWENIPGIWHKVKSRFNPDKRCEILENLAKDFPTTKHLKFAKSVEQLTLEKKANLILNVDWYIAAMLLDIFEDISMNYDEKKMYVEAWIFNGLFLLSRTIWFIGHAIDQKRLGEWLHRTSWDDILYTD